MAGLEKKMVDELEDVKAVYFTVNMTTESRRSRLVHAPCSVTIFFHALNPQLLVYFLA